MTHSIKHHLGGMMPVSVLFQDECVHLKACVHSVAVPYTYLSIDDCICEGVMTTAKCSRRGLALLLQRLFTSSTVGGI
jgi:hypothetical protein